MHYCLKCLRTFASSKALKSHYQRQQECNDHYLQHGSVAEPNIVMKNDIDKKNDFDDVSVNVDFFNNENDFILNDDIMVNNKLKERYKLHLLSGYEGMIESNKLIQSQIDLLTILKQAKAPLYLFDQIWKWTKQSAQSYNINFASIENVSRTQCLKTLKNTFDMNDLEPIKRTIQLKGSNNTIDVIVHKFEHCLYSLLSDNILMDPSNLLISFDNENLNNNTKTTIINDINTGSVYKKATEALKKSKNDAVLCPIIFFIDKTHTDVQGRLCLEQIRFTLGIFDRETRNNPNAWRTLGYIADQSYIKTKNSFEKNQDYHHMLDIILEDFKLLQKSLIEWDIIVDENNLQTVYLQLQVLLIMGDTDGHDKLAGRYTSRNGIQKPCRCCNVSFEHTDNPEIVYNYNKHSLINMTTQNTSADTLQSFSIHGVDNAWKDVLFCDHERGLYGSLCPDILHCIKHGLYNYALLALFDRKTAKDCTDIDEVSFSKKNVFNSNYSKHFDELAKRYGLFLVHQSDRELPRTHINTNYTTITRKNAHEMSGILLAILIVFNTDEGTNTLDEIMAGIEAAKFIQLFELLLMLENFCSTPEHKITNIKKFKEFMPYLLNTYKDILNRQTGCGCKFIKFHLPNHFADDMLRFGSMLNFDTEIGESHHKSEAKYPAQNTQRRRSEFEFQTATRQIENFAINKAFMYIMEKDDITKNEQISTNDNNVINKWYRYQYNPDFGLQQKTGKKKLKKCNWIDRIFQQQLSEICQMIYKNGCIDGKLNFFTMHNRHSFLFRADPNYKDNECWYDWAEVNWSNELIPTKLLLFWDIEKDSLKKAFKIGDITIKDPGQYVLCYSLKSHTELQPAHTQSILIQYGSLDIAEKRLPKLYIFHIDCIASTISAVPYKVSDHCYNAIEWIFLRPKDEWYNIYINHMTEELERGKKRKGTHNLTKKQKTN
jgi:hypothetical protein